MEVNPALGGGFPRKGARGQSGGTKGLVQRLVENGGLQKTLRSCVSPKFTSCQFSLRASELGEELPFPAGLKATKRQGLSQTWNETLWRGQQPLNQHGGGIRDQRE